MLSYTLNLIPLENKISVENYPEIIYEDKSKKVEIHESDIRLTILNRSWFNIENSSLTEFLENIISNKLSFCPSVFNTKNNLIGYPLSFDYYFRYQNGYSVITAKDILPYDAEYPKENHVWRSKSTFKSCRILMIDIDEGYDLLEEIKNKISESPLKDCSFIYKTFSYNEELKKIKVRIGWVLDEEITDINELEMYLSFLVDYFNGDKSCVDASRFYFPGKELVYANDNIIFKKELFLISNTKQNDISNKEILIKSTNILKQVDHTDIINILKNKYYYSIQVNKITNFNWEENIKTISDFIDFSTTHFKYRKLFYFALNLNIIKSGLKWLKENMILNNEKGISHYNEMDFQILTNVRKYDYIPISLLFFERCKNDKTFFIKVIEKPEIKITRDEGISNQINAFDEALNAKDNSIYAIKGNVGGGKTHIISQINKSKIIIANFTHQLTNDFHLRCKNPDDYTVTPKRPRFEDKGLNKQIEYLEMVGNTSKISNLLSQYAKHNTNDDSKLIKEYKFNLKSCFDTKSNLLMTQAMSFNFFNNIYHDTIIYDEDPTQLMISANYMYGSDIKKMYENPIFTKHINYLINEIKTSPYKEYYMINFDIDNSIVEDEVNTNKIYNSNIIRFFQTNVIHFNILEEDKHKNIKDLLFEHGLQYTYYFKFPGNKKIVIASATIQEDKLKILYGDRVKFSYIDNIKTIGNNIQDTRYSFTEHCLLTNPKSMQYLNTVCNMALPTITSLSLKSLFPNSVKDMHFGNILGYDTLRGKKMNIIGTPSKPSWYYIIILLTLNPNIYISNFNFSKRIIKYNGFEFQFVTFEDPTLQQFHLNDINSELIQAVGRARLIWEDVTVFTYASLPLKDAEFVYQAKNCLYN
jgi:hypothetical protein